MVSQRTVTRIFSLSILVLVASVIKQEQSYLPSFVTTTDSSSLVNPREYNERLERLETFPPPTTSLTSKERDTQSLRPQPPKQLNAATSNSKPSVNPRNLNLAEHTQYNEDRRYTFCLPWEVNGDEWWTHHRDWEAGSENETHYCFRKVQDPDKAQFFRNLYRIQFKRQCDSMIVKRMWSSGWGADMLSIVDGLHHAYRTSKPMQILESMAWHYAFPKRSVDSSKPIRSACPLKNVYCYLLNMTHCSSANRTTADSPEMPYLEDARVLYDDSRYRWYIEWLVRPQTWLRKRVYDYIQQQAPTIETPCTAMHVRRNDVVLHDAEARKYHSIQEYIDSAGLSIRPNILLMTDDHNAIGEALTLSPQYHWMFLDRPRFSGVGGWEHQTPSDDPAFEVVVLFALFQLVRNCEQIILSEGKFSSYLYQEMIWNRNEEEVDVVNIDKDTDYKEILNPSNYHSHAVSKNYDPEDITSDKKKKRLTSGGERFIGNRLSVDQEFDGTFCQPWDVGADEWWTHHPTWEMGVDNETHYCFQPIKNRKRANYLKDLYDVQFVSGDCNEAISKRMWSSGWGADFENLIDGLIYAKNERKPMQIGKERWHYADPAVKLDDQQRKGVENIACPQRNMFCYFLQISRCKPKKSWEGDFLAENRKGQKDYIWLSEYATRPQIWLRKRVHDFVQQQRMEYFDVDDCAVIHVRRGDVIHHEATSRRYHAINEYVDYAKKEKVNLHKNIFLLSDDHNAFAEAKVNYPGYNWMQINRPRKEAKDAEWEQHLPSDDPIFEMVVILSTFEMVKQCNQFVYSTSNFAQHIRWKMDLSGKSTVYLNIDDGKEEGEVFSEEHVATKNISKHFDDQK